VVTFGSDSTAVLYSVQSQYWREGGRSGIGTDQVIAWGRWAGANADANLNTFGTRQSIAENQGFHYLYGYPASNTAVSNAFSSGGAITMTLIGGTVPTEVRAGALAAWRLTGGSVTLNFASLALSGNLNLFYSSTGGYGNYDMTWNKTMSTSSFQAGTLENLNTTVKRTNGTADICVTSCGGTAVFGVYAPKDGTEITHSGMAYTFNTGSYNVQGVAAFKK
jgi:hypothetical protein